MMRRLGRAAPARNQAVLSVGATRSGQASGASGTYGDLLLSASSNGRYLQRPSGEPFLMAGQSAWCLSSQLDQTDALIFLDDQESRGINTLIVGLCMRHWTTNSPNNAANVSPFTGTVAGGQEDLSTPREAFWAHVDWVLAQCAQRGIVVVAAPLYMGNGGVGQDGWWPELDANSQANCEAFGTFIGERYANQQNLIWLMGGDRVWANYTNGTQTKLTALADAIKAADPNHLMTGHFLDSQSYLVPGPWQDCTFIYCDSVTHNDVLDGYADSPTVPTFLGEGLYVEGPWEGGDPDRKKVRSQFWQAMTSGGCGFLGGDENVWPFGGPNGFGSTTDWEAQLGNDFALDHGRVKSFFDGRAWHLLEPDTGSALVTAGRGTLGTADYGTAALASDDSWAAIWIPGGGSVTVNCSTLSGPVTAQWYDPSNGSYSSAGSGLTGSQSFDPGLNAAGDTDMVLLLEAA